MSKRPANLFRSKNTNNNNGSGYVIIGDTAAATLYARRLLNNNISQPIYIITEGMDRINTDGILDPNFVMVNSHRMLNFLKTEQIHMIPSGDNDHEDDGHIIQKELVIHHYIGTGKLGDFITSYHIPRLGPWFTHTSNGRLERFLSESTMKSPLSPQESVIVDKISNLWKIPKTSFFIVREPSVLSAHYIFLQGSSVGVRRKIFYDEYHRVNSATNVDYITELSQLKITQNGSGLYNVLVNDTNLENVRVVWKTNHFTFLRLVTEAGIKVHDLLVPTFYRAVLSIPVKNSDNECKDKDYCSCFSSNLPKNTCSVSVQGRGVDLTDVEETEDFLTSHVTFSLYDIGNPKHTGISWLVQAYTTREDFSIIHPAGKYADSNYHLLIVEAVSTKNKRRTSYNIGEREIKVNYNDRITEANYLSQFAHIVSGVYNVYTGLSMNVSSLLEELSLCTSNAICHDANLITDYSFRQSPMITVLDLVSNLYGMDIYPSIKF